MACCGVVHRKKRGGRVCLEEHEKSPIGDKVTTRYVRYLGVEVGPKKGASTIGRLLDLLQKGPSKRAGSVRLLWRTAEDLGF